MRHLHRCIMKKPRQKIRPEVAICTGDEGRQAGCSMVGICRSPSIILPGSGRREEAYRGIPTRMSGTGSGTDPASESHATDEALAGEIVDDRYLT